jgi:ATP-dependent DNA ligase
MKSKPARAIRFGEFIPTMQPSYAEPHEVMAAHGVTFADIKYDGYRAQIHKWSRGFRVFTRNGNELNYECYPEIVKIVKKLPTCIIEAELIGEGNSHKEAFDNVKKRFRRPGISQSSMEKYAASGIIADAPLSLRVFETLKYGRKSLMGSALRVRREYTERFDSRGIQPSETDIVAGVDALEAVIESTFKAGHEGRVCKNPESFYLPDKRTIDWVKFKRSDPLDLAIVGFYNETAYGLDLPFTSVLCATYNEETGRYETLGKIGATRNGLANEIQDCVKGKVSGARPDNVDFSEKLDRHSYRKFVPDWYINPEDSIVLEVNAMNLNRADNWQTCGYDGKKAFSMRIGFAKQVRYDKLGRQATTTQAVHKLYGLQEKGGAKK